MNDLAPLLKAARGPRSAAAVASASGLSRRSICLYESGTVPTLMSLVRLMDALGLSPVARRDILAAHMAATTQAAREGAK